MEDPNYVHRVLEICLWDISGCKHCCGSKLTYSCSFGTSTSSGNTTVSGCPESWACVMPQQLAQITPDTMIFLLRNHLCLMWCKQSWILSASWIKTDMHLVSFCYLLHMWQNWLSTVSRRTLCFNSLQVRGNEANPSIPSSDWGQTNNKIVVVTSSNVT